MCRAPVTWQVPGGNRQWVAPEQTVPAGMKIRDGEAHGSSQGSKTSRKAPLRPTPRTLCVQRSLM